MRIPCSVDKAEKAFIGEDAPGEGFNPKTALASSRAKCLGFDLPR
jgi:hypothetical protein